MSSKTFTISKELHDYVLDVGLREADVLTRLRKETAAQPLAMMQISPEQGQLMGLLTRLLGVTRALEVGVFTGYSSLCVALAMPPEGRLVACDVSEEWTSIAKRYWHDAGVAQKIELRLAPAKQTLDALIADGQSATFDFAFIDADKAGYADYYERSFQLLRPGGLMAVDNTLWSGAVVDPTDESQDTVAIRAFNAMVHADERVSMALLPIGDGLTLARKL